MSYGLPHYVGVILKRIFDLRLRITRSGKHIILVISHRFRKALLSNCFPSTLKRKDVVFKFLRIEERFRNALLS